jgi:hypothetical protein
VASHAIEYLLLFFIAPTLCARAHHRIPAIPALLGALAYCLFVLLRDARFNRGRLWNAGVFWRYAPAILILFAAALIGGILLVLRYAPERFLYLPRSNPGFWGVIMLLYPIASVYPQAVIYRAFLFEHIGTCSVPRGPSCWPARRRSHIYPSCFPTASRSASCLWRDCCSRSAIGRRARCLFPRSGTRFTGARYSQLAWGMVLLPSIGLKI